MEDKRGYCTKYIPTADPVGMGRKLCQYTIFQYSVQAQLSAHTDWISCRYVFGVKSASSILCPHLPSLIYGSHYIYSPKIWGLCVIVT